MQVVKTAGLQTLPAAKITVSLTEITLSQPILTLSKKLQIHTFKPPHFSKRLSSKMMGDMMQNNKSHHPMILTALVDHAAEGDDGLVLKFSMT
jgi:hypothetical protein